MPSNVVTHLHDDTGRRLCRAQAGPAIPTPALLDDTSSEGIIFCAICARGVLSLMVLDITGRCGGDPLLDAILALALTPPDHTAAVTRILCPALEELDAYVAQLGGHHA